MTEPTKEQIKELWEWCGIKQDSDRSWRDADGIGILVSTIMPEADLNNLFKYAVPKLIEKGLGCTVTQDNLGANACTYTPFASAENGVNTEGKSDDPALALFWAIWEIIHRD